MCTLIRNRLPQKKDTFGVFIDFKKAFDYVDRNALLYKLLSSGINGKFYNSVKSMLSDTSACVKLNGMLTDWFPVSSGVRQGDSSSPTIFAFFINDLICGLKTFGKLKNINHSRERITAPYPFSWLVAIIISHGMYTSSMWRVQLLMVCGMGWGDINDNNCLLNITVDIKIVLFFLTHAVLMLTCFCWQPDINTKLKTRRLTTFMPGGWGGGGGG